MENSVRFVLSPLLLISYMCGLRIVEFPAGYPRLWISFLYISLLWSVYCYFVINRVMFYIPPYSSEYRIYVFLNIFTVLFSIFLGVYHDKKFRNCLKKLAVVDDTLGKLGTTTNYQKLNKKIMWIVLGWFILVLLLNCNDYIRWREFLNILTSIYVTFMLNYCTDINIIDDLIFACILRYIELKFDQVNEQMYKLTTKNVCRTKRTWEKLVLHSQQRKLPNTPGSEYVTWILIHLHLELRKISREINSIFEVQLTCKMVCYFGFIAELFRQLFTAIFVRNYVTSKKILVVAIIIFWLAWYISRLLLINYMCERVSTKTKMTSTIINRISYFTYNAEPYKTIMPFLLQITQAPLKFLGLGLFQFGYKFFYRYSESILALVIILIQTDKFKQI